MKAASLLIFVLLLGTVIFISSQIGKNTAVVNYADEEKSIKVLGILAKLNPCIKATLCYKLELTSDKISYVIKTPFQLVKENCETPREDRDCLIEKDTGSRDSTKITQNLDSYLGKPVQINGFVLPNQQRPTLQLKRIKEKLVTGKFALGDQKMLILMVDWPNNPNQHYYSKEDIERIVFNDQTGFAGYVKNVSQEKTKLSGMVAGWFYFDFLYDPTSCGYNATTLNKQIKDAGINTADFNRLVYFRGYNPACGGGGSGSTGGARSEITLEGYVNDAVMAHEFGHNLSLGHANYLECPVGSDVYNFDQCQKRYYGDPFTPMGHANAVSYHGFHLMSLGYLAANEVVDVNKSGVYRIYRLNPRTNGKPMVLRLYKPDVNRHYYLDYRTPSGLDTPIYPQGLGGVTIRVSDYTQFGLIENGTNKYYLSPESFLVSPSNEPRALHDGEILNDSVNNIKIKQLKHTDRYTEVEITVPKTTNNE